MTARSIIAPLQTLLETRHGSVLPLPPTLVRLFGEFRMQKSRSGPRVFSNFVSTLDGVVSLRIKGHDGGGDISGFSAQDRMVMGLLRATADVVIVGGGSLEADSGRMWTAEAICPELAADYRVLNRTLRGERAPLRVVVSSSGRLDLSSPVFAARRAVEADRQLGGPWGAGGGRDAGGASLLIVTTRAGARQLSAVALPEGVAICAIGRGRGALAAPDILEAVGAVARAQRMPMGRVLVEGGPRLLAGFYAAQVVDEQFLTLAPQLAGREVGDGRISLVMGELFAPKAPRWGTLAEVRRGGNHLFLRYFFKRGGTGGA
jgi:riboflavin biosynthesis pyrimidine reductase